MFLGMTLALAVTASDAVAGPSVRLDPGPALLELRHDRFELNCDFIVENKTPEAWRLAEIQLPRPAHRPGRTLRGRVHGARPLRAGLRNRVRRGGPPSSFGGFSKVVGGRSIPALRRPLDTGEILEVR